MGGVYRTIVSRNFENFECTDLKSGTNFSEANWRKALGYHIQPAQVLCLGPSIKIPRYLLHS